MRLDHTNITAPTGLLEREKGCFCDVLGLREGDRSEFGARGYWLYAGDRAVVHLSEGETDAGRGSIHHAAFRSSGLERLIRVLDEKSVDYSTVEQSELDMTQLFFRTPADAKFEVNFVGERLRAEPS